MNKRKQIGPRAREVGCDVAWQDEVLTQCSRSQHPSSLLVEGAGRARVSAPPAPWCHALVAMGVVRHHNHYKNLNLRNNKRINFI